MRLAISTSLRADARIARRGRRGRSVIAAIAAITGLALLFAASRSSAFHARSVELTGARRLAPDQVVRAAGVSEATNALWLDEGAVERRLEAMPWIASATVRVAFPLTIEIRIVERSPVAVARDGAGLVLLSADGTALGRVEHRAGLPLIETVDVAAVEGVRSDPVGAAAALGAMPADLRERVGRIRVVLDGTLELWIADGPRIAFGTPDRAVRKARSIVRVLAWAERQGLALRAVSVVEPSRPAVTLG